jgi:hypothetical protein
MRALLSIVSRHHHHHHHHHKMNGKLCIWYSFRLLQALRSSLFQCEVNRESTFSFIIEKKEGGWILLVRFLVLEAYRKNRMRHWRRRCLHERKQTIFGIKSCESIIQKNSDACLQKLIRRNWFIMDYYYYLSFAILLTPPHAEMSKYTQRREGSGGDIMIIFSAVFKKSLALPRVSS